MNLMILLIVMGLISLLPLVGATGVLRRPIHNFVKILEWIVKAAFFISAVCGACVALAQLSAVITRNLFGVNFIWLQESAIYFFGLMFLLAGGAILLMDAHVRVDVFYAKWSERRQRLVNILGLYLFVIPVGFLILWASGPYVAASWATYEGSNDPSGIQGVFLLKSLVPAFGSLLIMAATVAIERHLNPAFHGEYHPGEV
ncbi:TRAP transporter small permease subunit [Parvularcula marina]|uniref:TRAP transporter small permease subunit n=1 Tax=Parvularcula marina TaxID=2292771 RepID=UPI00351419B8